MGCCHDGIRLRECTDSPFRAVGLQRRVSNGFRGRGRGVQVSLVVVGSTHLANGSSSHVTIRGLHSQGNESCHQIRNSGCQGREDGTADRSIAIQVKSMRLHAEVLKAAASDQLPRVCTRPAAATFLLGK